ncbi:hypothetical protein Ae201684_000486 [Aphanomyces euteiches]|uniref:Uncharacterized protein n=1 Tax=Aphanomyces euteiches TaxID=100861 RepID=A0A6G0XY29_9STRA|nr:hypothetical protein Ae201684_000486 [Aphanomyces euteiches]KAH9153061.1 hypothetical protein AeRB84_004623 [Aphanomyces euteiches]
MSRKFMTQDLTDAVEALSVRALAGQRADAAVTPSVLPCSRLRWVVRNMIGRATIWVFVAIAVFVSAKGNRHSRVDRVWRMQKKRCEENECREFNSMTNMNCVHQCISSTCFDKIYAAEPLEDGEVDDYRFNKYLICIRDDYRERMRKPKDEL